MPEGLKITRIVVKNYRGIVAREIQVPSNGGLLSGRNAAGKTSFLEAVRAALTGEGVDRMSIRNGADKAEIVIDLDELTVRRGITQKGDSLKVLRGDAILAKPQTRLEELLGSSPVDPLRLFLMKPAEQRKHILQALPLAVSVEELRKYVPEVPDHWDVSGHGLEVVERLRKYIYEKRATANSIEAGARREAELASAGAERLAAQCPAEPGPALPDAEAAEADAGRALMAVEAAAAEAERAAERTAGARARIAALRAKADATRAHADYAPEPATRDSLARTLSVGEAEAERTRAAIAVLTTTLARLDAEIAETRMSIGRLENQQARHDKALAEADGLVRQAAELERTIAETTAPPIAPEAIAAARQALADARMASDKARRAEARDRAEAEAEARERTLAVAEADAAKLDGYVKALSGPAQSALLSGCGSIPGLAIEGDDVLLDGKRLGALCGAERMFFAIDVAKRLARRGRFLFVDDLEHLDPEQLPLFVRAATAGGWQLIGAKVDRGAPVWHAWEIEDAAPA